MHEKNYTTAYSVKKDSGFPFFNDNVPNGNSIKVFTSHGDLHLISGF